MRHYDQGRLPGEDADDDRDPEAAWDRGPDDEDDAHRPGDDGLDDLDLDDEFPRGDGTADTSAVAYCPYCGELNELAVDPGGGSPQRYVEDCHVCCQPWRVTVAFDHDGQATAQLEALDE
jgi:hypothetical protein